MRVATYPAKAMAEAMVPLEDETTFEEELLLRKTMENIEIHSTQESVKNFRAKIEEFEEILI